MLDFANGYTWLIDDWMRLDCVLLSGSDGGAPYTGERMLTAEDARAVKACLAEDGMRVVQRALESRSDPALLVLTMAAALGDTATRAAASNALGVHGPTIGMQSSQLNAPVSESYFESGP